MRAIEIDPVVVWAPQGSWLAVDAVFSVLLSEKFSIAYLAAVLRLPAVTDQRLLRGVLACFGPGMDSDPALRLLLSDALSGLERRMDEYDKWAGDGDGTEVLHQDEIDALGAQMAAAHPLYIFSHKQYTDARLRGCLPVGLQRLRGPGRRLSLGLPVLRPKPGFLGAATANTDLPTCSHEMGKENAHTGGTVRVFCTCAHHTGNGVMVLTGSESQLMPLKFVAHQFVKMPQVIVYDFASATLMSALVRLCALAR